METTVCDECSENTTIPIEMKMPMSLNDVKFHNTKMNLEMKVSTSSFLVKFKTAFSQIPLYKILFDC